jgi:hypothetical protein
MSPIPVCQAGMYDVGNVWFSARFGGRAGTFGGRVVFEAAHSPFAGSSSGPAYARPGG